MKATRNQVFGVINGERAYQTDKWGPDEDKKNPVAAFLTFMRYHMRRAEELASTMSDADAALDQIRKVTTLGVACMETHGAPAREGYGAQITPDDK